MVITYVLYHNYAKIKIDSYNPLPLEKMLTFHKVIILIKSGFNKDKKLLLQDIFRKRFV